MMKKRVLCMLLAVCILFAALPVTASAKGINRYTEVLQGLISKNVSGANGGVFYDLNGDGIEELLVIRTRNNAQYDSVTELAASIYTVRNEKAVALVEDEVLYLDAGGPDGWLSVVEKDGQIYACTYGETGGTSPPMHRNGWYKLYRLDESCNLQTAAQVEFKYFIPDYDMAVDYSQSSATMNGSAISYADCEAWVNSLNKKLCLEYFSKDMQTFNALLKKAKADNTGSLARPTVGGFKDVYEGEYYADGVLWAVQNGITSGTGDGTLFSPLKNCTRGEIVTFLWRAQGSPKASTDAVFTDVAPGAYYEKAVQWAVANGITDGTGNGRFDPDVPCTRAQAVTFMWRAAGKPSASGSSFADVPSGEYYADAVKWAVQKGVTSGTGNGFNPDGNCTRGQIVTFLYRGK